MSRTRVVVTGMGTSNPVGGDVPSTWDALVNGRSGVRFLTDVGDRGTAFIFADGAGAVVVGPSDEPGIGPVVWGCLLYTSPSPRDS